MYKVIIIWVLVLGFVMSIVLSGCAESKKLCFDEARTDCKTVEPYGLFDQKYKDSRVEYDVSVGNVVLSVIFCETLLVPVVLLGWDLWEPVRVKK